MATSRRAGTGVLAGLLTATLLGGCVPGETPTAEPSAASTPQADAEPEPPHETPSAGPTQEPTHEPAKAAEPVEIPASGPAHYKTAKFARPAPEGGAKRHIKVNVKVEENLPYDPEEFARATADTLQDSRSWVSKGEARFDFVGEDKAEMTIYLLTPGTTDRRCAPLRTFGRVSCQQGSGVNLNAVRWKDGVPDFNGDLDLYRHYLVNHEVGHYLGHGHQSCPKKDAVAPIMMQQTKGLNGCRANGWPANG